MRKIILALVIIISSCSSHQKGSGLSQSSGTVSNGTLDNGRKFPYRGDNFRFFSWTSFHIFNRAWVHSNVLDITLAAYESCETSCKNQKFLLMECSHKHGGKMWPHRTHQNGTSIDFATPLLKENDPTYAHHRYGLFHYGMSFNSEGVKKGNKKVKIDFETMGKHILALESEARKRGMYIKKVIFKINLKDNFYASKAGKRVKAKGIYFANSLPKKVDDVHDDHYHIDFAFL